MRSLCHSTNVEPLRIRCRQPKTFNVCATSFGKDKAFDPPFAKPDK